MTLQFSLDAAAPETADTACVVVGVYEQGMLTSAAARVDSATGGALKRQIESGDITGKTGSRVAHRLTQPGPPLPAVSQFLQDRRCGAGHG